MRLQARVQGEGQGQGQKQTVVLLHGLFGSARNFGAVQAILAADYRVAAFDLRNHGASPHGTPMDYPSMAADVAETLQAEGLSPCAVLGHSMGGKVAMRLALDYPALARRLVVADIAPVAYPGVFAAFAQAMRAIDLSAGLSRAQANAALEAAVPDAGIRGFLLMNLQFGPQPHWKIGLDEIIGGMANILGWPETDRCYAGPALFLNGGKSDYVTQAMHPAIRRLFPAAMFETIPQAGHWLHADDPARFIASVKGFLGQGDPA